MFEKEFENREVKRLTLRKEMAKLRKSIHTEMEKELRSAKKHNQKK